MILCILSLFQPVFEDCDLISCLTIVVFSGLVRYGQRVLPACLKGI